MKDIKHGRDKLDEIWSRVMNSRERSDSIDTLEQLVPVVLALFAHVEELQAEVNRLRGELKGELK